MFELQKHQRELNRTSKLYDNLIDKAKKEKKTQDEIDSLIGEMFAETGIIEEEIKSILSRKWIQKAEKLMLPIPDYDDDECWEKGVYTQSRFLKAKGITKIRNLVREENSAQRKGILDWVIPIIGIIGAVTGLLAVVLSKSR
jgi:hypothetical protein